MSDGEKNPTPDEFIEPETAPDLETVPPAAESSEEPPGVQPVDPPKAGPQLDPTDDLSKKLSPEELLAQVNVAKKNRWLGIFIQLSRSERFLQFVERNYVIQDRIDEEKKQISTVVIENPRAVGPGLSKVQVAKIFNLLKMYSCRHPKRVLEEILKTLGQEESAPAIITSANEKDVKEAAEQSELKDKLD